MLTRSFSLFPSFFSYSRFVPLALCLQHGIENADPSSLFSLQHSSVNSSIPPEAVIYVLTVRLHTATALQKEKLASIAAFWKSAF